jgi:hypothetical protein
MREDEEDEKDDEDDRVTRNLAGLAFTLALVVIGLFLIRQLGATSKLQDCVMSGRTNCAPIDNSSGGR